VARSKQTTLKSRAEEAKQVGEDFEASGKTTIAPEVLLTIARLTTLNTTGVSRLCAVPGGVNRLFNRGVSEGVRIDIQNDDIVNAELYVVLKNDVNIRDVSREIQHKVARAISEMVGMQVGRVNIHIEDIDYPTEPEA
jgi:uncharacterized alkaline shock family protein YloU